MVRLPIIPILAIIVLALLAAGCSAPERSALPPYQPGGVVPVPLAPSSNPPAFPSTPAPVPSEPNVPPSSVPIEPVPLPPDTVIPQPPVPLVVANNTPIVGANNSSVVNPAPANASSNSSSSANASAAANPSAACSQRSGSALLDCVQTLAVSRNDVSICVDDLGWKDLRYQCITYWCSSSGRDYNQCQNLRDYDSRIGCLNKCNPNSNT